MSDHSEDSEDTPPHVEIVKYHLIIQETDTKMMKEDVTTVIGKKKCSGEERERHCKT